MSEMNTPAAPIRIALRIPGQWSHPSDLSQRLPAGCRLTPEALIAPDATPVEFGAAAADDQFAQIFRSSCRRPATADELATGARHTANGFLSAPRGAPPPAPAQMEGRAAPRAGPGAGR